MPLVYIPLEAVVSKWYGESEKQLAGERRGRGLGLRKQMRQFRGRCLPASIAAYVCMPFCPPAFFAACHTRPALPLSRADMLKACESFPDGCIIFLDELDALATSRSSGACPGACGFTLWHTGLVRDAAGRDCPPYLSLACRGPPPSFCFLPCLPLSAPRLPSLCFLPHRFLAVLQRCTRPRGACWVCCSGTSTDLTRPASARS